MSEVFKVGAVVAVVAVIVLLLVAVVLQVQASRLELLDVEDDEELGAAEDTARGIPRGEVRRKLVGDDWA